LPQKGEGRVRYQVYEELNGFRKGDIVQVKGKWVKQVNATYAQGRLAFRRVKGEPAVVRVPSPVTLVPLDKLHETLPDQQAREDLHLTSGDALHLAGDLLADTQVPADEESEQSDIPEEDDEDTQKSGAIKVPHQESTQREALSTAVPDDFHHQSGEQSSRRLEVVVLVTRIVMAIIIVLFFLVFPRIVLPKSTLHATLQLSAGVVATAPVAVATATPLPIPGLTIIPDHFNATTGCTFAQGKYRCIITLTLSKNHHNKLKWSISRSGLTATFSPAKGRLRPGHPQQIVIYIYNDCPYSGSLIFSTGGKTLSIPWRC
jgi:hypothetical protein